MPDLKKNEPSIPPTIYWDDAHIANESAALPAALREPYIWLKTYLRDECKHDVDVLVQRFREVGVTIDKTNWTRIVKGRWRHDTHGAECTPCIAADNLVLCIQALHDQVRVEILQGRTPFVETSIYHSIRRFIEKKMRRDRVNRFGLIVGPTGTQKTASYKELAQRSRFIKWLEAPDNGSIKEFVVRLAVKCGGSPNISYFAARAKLFSNITAEHCIVVDNTQDMVRSRKEMERMGKPGHTQPAYQLMRSLQDETGCAIIWSITPENEEQMFARKDASELIYNEQFEGRCGGLDGFLRLPNFSPKADLVKIAETFGFRDADRHADRLCEISRERGRIRRYFEILQDAKDEADADGRRLGIAHLETVLEEIAERAAKKK